MSFCAEQLARLKVLWDRMLQHRFLLETRDGTIPEERFAVWIRQDYLFVEPAIPFIAALIPKAPARHVEELSGVIGAFSRSSSYSKSGPPPSE